LRKAFKISVVFNFTLLISLLLIPQFFWAQSGLDEPINYEAQDSIVADIKSEIVKLYGEAKVTYDNIELTADFIEIDMKNNEVIATYSLDTAGLPVGKPIFSSDGETSTCDYMKYNFKTKKGYIKEVRAQQDEGYIHMAESKIHPNEQIHLKNGKFTTCDKENPHYHFKMTKAIIVPDKRIVTGPVFMKIGKIPTPLAAPFGFFPTTKTRKHGLVIGDFGQATGNSGFGLRDFGYYIPLGDYFDTQILGSIFTTGQWNLSNQTSYYKKYNFRGGFGLRYERLKGYFYDTDVRNKFSINWRHSQDAKAHPSLTFSSDVNFKSDNNSKTTLEANNQEFFSNQFNSTLKLSKRWKAGKFKGSANLNTSLKQNSTTQNYNLDLPSFSLKVNRFDLGVLRKQKIGKKWYESIQVQYGLNSKNQISAPDSVFNINDLSSVGDFAKNGIEQNASVSSQLKIFGARLNFSPRVSYREVWNFQHETHEWNNTTEHIDTTKYKGLRTARNMSFAATLTGNFYGLYRLKGKSETRFKHVATPNIVMSYAPDFSQGVLTTTDTNGTSRIYSPFISSLYKESGQGQSGSISFSLSNTLKMKTLNKKDTLNGSSKSFNLIDAANIRGSYDFLKDSLKLSNITLDFRTSKFLNIFSFQTTATLNPYAYDELNVTNSDYAWSNDQGVGRFTTANFTSNANFTSRNGRKKQKELAEKAAPNAIATGLVTDNKTVSFDIPWQLNIAYNLNFTSILKDTVIADSYRKVQTATVGGDFSINDKWKIVGSISADLQQLNSKYQGNEDRPYIDLISRWNVNIWRDLHCWEATLQLGQMGTWKAPWELTNFTFLFRVNIKASMLQDIKLEYNQPPFF
jgi:hypothetical protein